MWPGTRLQFLYRHRHALCGQVHAVNFFHCRRHARYGRVRAVSFCMVVGTPVVVFPSFIFPFLHLSPFLLLTLGCPSKVIKQVTQRQPFFPKIFNFFSPFISLPLFFFALRCASKVPKQVAQGQSPILPMTQLPTHFCVPEIGTPGESFLRRTLGVSTVSIYWTRSCHMLALACRL